MEMDLDSWDASFINAIPQIDGTFDIEDGVHEARKVNTKSGKCEAQVRTCVTNPDVTEVRQIVESCATCSCSSKTSRSEKTSVRAFEILQVDGSSDTDFWESCSNDKARSRKTPLRTYGKASQIRIRGSRNADRKKLETCNTQQRKDEDKEKTVKCIKQFEATEMFGERLEKKIERKVKYDEEIEDESTTEVQERERGKCESEERQSIFINQLSSHSSLGSQRDATVSPKAFYSRSKHLPSPTAGSSKALKRKRLSLKPLEFVEKHGSKDLSKSKKTKLLRSSSKSKKISFTEIVRDFSTSDGGIHKSGDKEIVQKGLISHNVEPKLSDIASINEASKLDVVRQAAALSKSSQSTREEEIFSSGSSVEFVAYRPGNEDHLPTRVRQTDAQSKEDLPQRSQNESENEDDSYRRINGLSGDISSSNDKIRECFVSLTDICSEEIIPHSAESSLSAKSNSRRQRKSSATRSRIARGKNSKISSYSHLEAWESSGGILIGSEDFSDATVCNSCCDSLFKSSFPSPVSLESHSSPPRVNSPTEAMDYTRLLPSNVLPSSILHSSTLNDNADRSAFECKEMNSVVENKSPHDVEICFQNDHFCAQIKPVRLNFDAERVEDGGLRPEIEEAEQDSHAKRKRKRIPRKSDRGGTKSDGVYLGSNSSSYESVINKTEKDGVDDTQHASLSSEDSLQSSDYCVKFSPMISNSISSEQQKTADTIPKSKKRLGLGRLFVAKKSTKLDHSKTFNVPSVGDVTQADLSLHDELEDSNQFSSGKSPSNSDLALSENIDGLKEFTDRCATAERKEQATTTVDKSFQASAVTIRSSNDERGTSSANVKKGDKESRASASFVVMESKEIILADDSIAITPEKDSASHIDSKRVVEEGSLFTLSSGQHVENTIVIDLEADGSMSPTVSVAHKNSDHVAIGNGEDIMEVGDREQGDSVEIPDTPEKEVSCIVKQDDIRPMKLSHVLFATSAQAAGIQHSSVSSFVNTNSIDQDLVPPLCLQNKSAMRIQSDASQPPLNIAKEPSVVLTPLRKPPSSAAILSTAKLHGLGETRHRKAFFSNPKDLPARSRYVFSLI